jgi:hypothetical protein
MGIHQTTPWFWSRKEMIVESIWFILFPFKEILIRSQRVILKSWLVGRQPHVFLIAIKTWHIHFPSAIVADH